MLREALSTTLKSLPESFQSGRAELLDMLQRHQSECREQLEKLKKASEDVIAASKPARK